MNQFILALFFSAIACYAQGQITLELDTPGVNTPLIFAKNIISTNSPERDIAISKNGDEIYYSSGNILFIKRQQDGTWSLPEIASFSVNQQDIEPAFSADGQRLYFSRNTGQDNNIYYVERNAGGGWSQAVALGSSINTDANEFYPSLAEDGSLYYTANYPSGLGGEDIWYAKFENGSFQASVPVFGVSEATDEFNAYVSPDESVMFFGSFGRDDGQGGGDIYVSRSSSGNWSSGINVSSVNTSSLDFSPFLSSDGRFLFFTSRRAPEGAETASSNIFDVGAVMNRLIEPQSEGGDIYWIAR